METKTIFGTDLYQVEACTNEKGDVEGQIIEGVSLLLYRKRMIQIDEGKLSSIELTKEDAKELAIQLLKLSSEPVPQRGGISLDIYQEWGISLHHAVEKGGKLINEPVICLSDVEAEDIPEDGYLPICLTNESARKMISGLAMIV